VDHLRLESNLAADAVAILFVFAFAFAVAPLSPFILIGPIIAAGVAALDAMRRGLC
jgi:hypothetical protein